MQSCRESQAWLNCLVAIIGTFAFPHIACQLMFLKMPVRRHSLAHLVKLGVCPLLLVISTKDPTLGRINFQHINTARNS